MTRGKLNAVSIEKCVCFTKIIPKLSDSIDVGYEFTAYTTTEGDGFVTLCTIIMNSDEGSLRPFVISSTTEDGVASKSGIEQSKKPLQFSLFPVSGFDYVGVSADLIFGFGDSCVCHNVTIIDDGDCEIDPIEDFFLNLAYVSGEQPINIDPDRTRVIIDDTSEPECGRLQLVYQSIVLFVCPSH